MPDPPYGSSRKDKDLIDLGMEKKPDDNSGVGGTSITKYNGENFPVWKAKIESYIRAKGYDQALTTAEEKVPAAEITTYLELRRLEQELQGKHEAHLQWLEMMKRETR